MTQQLVTGTSDKFDSWLNERATRRWLLEDLPWLLVNFPSWINRRVETLDVLSESRFQRHNSIDLTITRRIGSPYSSIASVLPLGFLYKRHLRSFDITDEAGHTLPVLNEMQNRRISRAMLYALVLAVLSRQFTTKGPPSTSMARFRAQRDFRDISPQIDQLLAAPWEESSQALDTIRQHRLWRLLEADPWIPLLVENLAVGFVMYAVIAADEGDRRVLKYSYLHGFAGEPDVPLTTRMLAFLGWTPLRLKVDGVLATASASYHAEVAAPDGAMIAAAELVDGNDMQLDYDNNDQKVAHLRFSSILTRPVIPIGPETVVLDLWPSKNEVLRQVSRGAHAVTLLLTAAITIKLAGIAFNVWVPDLSWVSKIQVIPESASAVLVAVPAVVAFYFAIQEHPVVQRMLYGTMIRAGFAAALAFVAAASLVISGLPPGTHSKIWATLLIASLLNSLTLTIGRSRAARLKTALVKRSLDG